jgi:hypothetical protein
VLAGTFCGGQVAGTTARKLESCKTCDFYRRVQEEEGESVVPTANLIRRLHCAGRLD